MATSAIMGLAHITYWMVSLFWHLDYSFFSVFWPLSSTLYNLTLPLFVLGVALFLMWMTDVEKETASRPRVLFLCGALILLVGSIIRVAYNWWFWHSPGHIYYDIYSEVTSLAIELGIVLCAIATLFLCKSYLRGDISAKPKS